MNRAVLYRIGYYQDRRINFPYTDSVWRTLDEAREAARKHKSANAIFTNSGNEYRYALLYAPMELIDKSE